MKEKKCQARGEKRTDRDRDKKKTCVNTSIHGIYSILGAQTRSFNMPCCEPADRQGES